MEIGLKKCGKKGQRRVRRNNSRIVNFKKVFFNI